MSLPAPNLDDRKFQDIVDDAKRMIGRRCPEWTDHNVSDPGVTLIELFASMTEMMLYRLNQVPERNYVKFLEMIGISLEPPKAAVTDLRFRLSRAIRDEEGEEANERILRAQETVAATMRTETEEAIEFTTDRDLRMVRPRLKYLVATPGGFEAEEDAFARARERKPESTSSFAVYSPTPLEGDCIYFGFEADVSGNVIEIEPDGVRSAATGLNEDAPAQVWEWWNGIETRWERLPYEAVDTTYGFNQPVGRVVNDMPTGIIQVSMPPGLVSREVAGKSGYWLRARYTTDLPPRGPNNLVPTAYLKSPEIRQVICRTVGGIIQASNSVSRMNVVLGQSDGLPGQVFRMPHQRILALRPDETILVGEENQPVEEWEEWTAVDDFSASGENDRHFICDTLAGQILFGPSIPEPDGSKPRQYGAAPAKSMTVMMRKYRVGGGPDGNVLAGQVQVLKTSIPYIADVTNPSNASGGRSQETLERAKMRARASLRIRDRAVTAEDFAFLAERASPGVGRAHCVQAARLHRMEEGGRNIPPGVVSVLIVPSLSSRIEVPRPQDLIAPGHVRRQVEQYLDDRRLLTTILQVEDPSYVLVSTEIVLVADPKQEREQVRRSVQERLNAFINPVTGGQDGLGWPFGGNLTLADIYAQVHAARGVAFLRDVRIFVSRLIDPHEGVLSPEQPVSLADGIKLAPTELLCTREHRITARTIWEIE